MPYLPAIAKISAIITCGYSILFYGVKSLLKLKFDENTLMSVAAIASAVMGDFNEAFLIVILFSIGEYLEDYAVEKSHRRIEKLMDITTDVAYNVNGEKISAENIKEGDRILVRPGDKLCVDVKIVKGNTSFDTSNITGETLPLDVKENSFALAGYLNTGNAVICEATSDYATSTTAKIKEYVENARAQKASTEKFITKFSKIYTPVVIVSAIVIGIILTISGITSATEAIKRALTFMIASCPCALVISIPLSYYAAIGSAGKMGILIKGSKHINTLAKADAVAFDKTGTLTEGKLVLSEIKTMGNMTSEEVLNYANAVEVNSSHPIAKAICNAATKTDYKAEDVKEHFGKGIEGIVNGHKVSIGNNKLTSRETSDDSWNIVICIDGKDMAMLKLSDKVKGDAKQMLTLLSEKTQIKSAYILSGDSQAEVNRICNEIGNIKGYGNLLPEDKAHKLEKLKELHKNIVFVGDGNNDAPSLAVADFSISIGSGSSLALETGDATLLSHSLNAIVSVVKLARHTVGVVYSNLVFSLLAKLAVLVLAVIGIAPIWLALFADVGVLILAVLNSLSVLYKKF